MLEIDIWHQTPQPGKHKKRTTTNMLNIKNLVPYKISIFQHISAYWKQKSLSWTYIHRQGSHDLCIINTILCPAWLESNNARVKFVSKECFPNAQPGTSNLSSMHTIHVTMVCYFLPGSTASMSVSCMFIMGKTTQAAQLLPLSSQSALCVDLTAQRHRSYQMSTPRNLY